MSRAVLPNHVASIIKYQKDPLRALEMFNLASKEYGFRHNWFTYRCMIEKLGSHGEFDSMENVLSDMRMNIDSSLLEKPCSCLIV